MSWESQRTEVPRTLFTRYFSWLVNAIPSAFITYCQQHLIFSKVLHDRSAKGQPERNCSRRGCSGDKNDHRGAVAEFGRHPKEDMGAGGVLSKCPAFWETLIVRNKQAH